MDTLRSVGIFAKLHRRSVTGTELRAMRKLAGWSQRELAERSGTHSQTVRYWEHKPLVSGAAADRYFSAFEAVGITRESLLVVPDAAAGQKRCGATTRKGTRCMVRPIQGKCRCKFHGGLSTGPKSPEGRARIAEAQRLRWQNLRCRRAIEDGRKHRARLQPGVPLM